MSFKKDAHPPKVLVETWILNLKTSDNRRVKQHATNMLIGAFGNMNEVARFMKKNDIEV